jgi:hypothetical protein
MRILFNEKYSTGPGRGIKNVTFRNIFYKGNGENPSIIERFSEKYNIENIIFENVVINEKKIKSFKEGNIRIEKYTNKIVIK